MYYCDIVIIGVILMIIGGHTLIKDNTIFNMSKQQGNLLIVVGFMMVTLSCIWTMFVDFILMSQNTVIADIWLLHSDTHYF